MRLVQAQRSEVDAKALKFRGASKEDYGELIAEPSLVFEGEDLLIVFLPIEEDTGRFLQALRGIKYAKSWRTNGLFSQSRVLGFQPRITIRRDFCGAASMSREHPNEHAVLCEWGELASRKFQSLNPGRWEKQRGLVEQVKPEWVLPGGVFTSGIVNKDNPLRYHYDTGNFPDVWSAMYAMSFDCVGGELVIPELSLGFSFRKPALIMFNGQGLVHGVTPLKKRSVSGYRYSVVYYALQQMCHCGTSAEELERIRKVKTQRELRRLDSNYVPKS